MRVLKREKCQERGGDGGWRVKGWALGERSRKIMSLIEQDYLRNKLELFAVFVISSSSDASGSSTGCCN